MDKCVRCILAIKYRTAGCFSSVADHPRRTHKYLIESYSRSSPVSPPTGSMTSDTIVFISVHCGCGRVAFFLRLLARSPVHFHMLIYSVHIVINECIIYRWFPLIFNSTILICITVRAVLMAAPLARWVRYRFQFRSVRCFCSPKLYASCSLGFLFVQCNRGCGSSHPPARPVIVIALSFRLEFGSVRWLKGSQGSINRSIELVVSIQMKQCSMQISILFALQANGGNGWLSMC